MKKILLTCSGIPALNVQGGIASYVHELANNLNKKNYDVSVFVFRDSNIEAYPTIEQYKYVFFKMPINKSREKELVVDVYNKIICLNPDIIINNEVSYISGLFPVLKMGIIKISVVHGFSPSYINYTIAGIQGKISTYNWQWTDWIVCQNKQMAQGIIKKYKVASNRVVSINQTCSEQTVVKVVPEKVFTILYAGGGSKNKGCIEAYKICKKLSKSDMNFKFIWCLDTVKNIDKDLASDNRFVFAGKLNREDFIENLNNSDCIIIPSHMETGPMLLVEAMSTGTIPICNDIKYSAIPDIITNNINGFIIENNNINNYINIISLLLSSQKETLRIKTNTYKYYIENLSPTKHIEKYESIFTKNIYNVNIPQKMSNTNIIHCTHKYDMTKLRKTSRTRILYKLVNMFEVIINENKYRKFFRGLCE